MEAQITVEGEGKLSCGYVDVNREDSDTMLSVTLEILQEIAEVGSVDEEGRRTLFGEILQKLTATQTDRAAYMKLYSRKLSDVRRDRLDTDEPIDFLFCNAHCLLAFADIAEKTLASLFYHKFYRLTNTYTHNLHVPQQRGL